MDQKPFQELVFKTVKIVNAEVKYVDCQVVSIARNLFFLQPKATHFETMMATVDEVNSDETKVPQEFMFRSVLLDCFTAELDD